MNIKEVAETLERFAPLPLQESYDNAGLQIGLTAGEDVSGVLLCLDVTEEVIDEAERKGCNLIVAHHPLLFRPVKRITGQTLVERCVVRAIRKNIAIYAAHTNLDNAPGGVNFHIALKLGLEQVRFLLPLQGREGGSGVIGVLPEAEDATAFLNRVANLFGVKALRRNEGPGRLVNRVALCGGAGEFLLDEAVKAGADVFLTGEMGYHRYFGYDDSILIGVMGHYESEQYTVELLDEILAKELPQLKRVKSEIVTNPVRVNE